MRQIDLKKERPEVHVCMTFHHCRGVIDVSRCAISTQALSASASVASASCRQLAAGGSAAQAILTRVRAHDRAAACCTATTVRCHSRRSCWHSFDADLTSVVGGHEFGTRGTWKDGLIIRFRRGLDFLIYYI